MTASVSGVSYTLRETEAPSGTLPSSTDREMPSARRTAMGSVMAYEAGST